MRLVAVAGGFDPVHHGHLHLIKKARYLGNHLIVILARDDQLVIKKGYAFETYAERKEILESIRWVDEVVPNIDHDLSSRESLKKYRPNIFARGGDNLSKDNLLESEVCKQLGIEIVVGVGGFIKEQSSSKLVKDSAKTWLIDVDGTICSTKINDYENAKPVYGAEFNGRKYFGIDNVNKLYAMGNTIKIFTARGSSSGKDWRPLTEKQLSDWGVKYHHLIFGKPSADKIVDDKAVIIGGEL